MLRGVCCFDLRDTISKCFVIWTGHSELPVNLQRELFVSLLQIELRHRLVDKRLGAGAGESFLFGCYGVRRGGGRALDRWRRFLPRAVCIGEGVADCV